MRIGGLDDGRLDEPALRLVAIATHHNLGIGGLLGKVDVRLALVERSLVDDGIDEVGRIADVAHLHFGTHLLDILQHIGPQTLRDVHARGSRTLLALELEGTAEGSRGHGLLVGRGMHEDEVLATRLAHEARIADVAVEVLASLLPEALERSRRTREVDAGEMLRLRGHLADEGTAARQEVHHAIGQASLLVELHEVVVGEQGSGGGLPQRHITHQDRRHAEVRGDGREVERRHGQHKALQRTILRVVQLH